MLDYKIEKKADGWYVAGERFSNQTSATRYLSALFTGKATPKKAAASAPKKAAPKKAAEKEWGVMVGAGRVKMPVAPKRPVASRVKMPVTPKKAAPKKAAEKEWGVMVGAGRVKIGVRDAFPVLGGGLIETDEEGGTKHRPFVVVEVAPNKVRPFYMSTGTGGQTDSGEWNLFGGIAEQSGRVSLGWFIKPTEGKRVEKYAAVSAFLAEKFGEDSDTAWRRIQRAVPGAKVYSELVGGELPTEETPRRVERRKRRRVMGGLLNSYLGKLNAIAAFQPDFEPEVGHRRSAGEHKTVYGAGRVAFNPRNPSEGERHISYEEQERRRKLYAPSREKEAERRRLREALAILAKADLEAGRVAEARKKGSRARPPKPVYTKEYLASKGMKRNGRVNETVAYILGLDIYDETDRRRLTSFKKSLQNDPVLRELFHKAAGYVLATTPSSKIEAALRSRRREYRPYVRPLDALTKLSNEADEKGWVDRAAMRKKKSAFAEAAPAAEKKPPSAPKKKRPPAPSKAAAFIKSAFAEAAPAAEKKLSEAAFQKKYGMSRLQAVSMRHPATRHWNPLEAYQQRAPDGTTFQRVYVGSDATLDIEFSQTDWSRPGAPKTVRILPSSRGHLGTLVRNLTNRWSTADDVLTAAVAAEASADDMFNAYPRYQYRDAAHYYEALTEVLTDLAASLQRGWR